MASVDEGRFISHPFDDGERNMMAKFDDPNLLWRQLMAKSL